MIMVHTGAKSDQNSKEESFPTYKKFYNVALLPHCGQSTTASLTVRKKTDKAIPTYRPCRVGNTV